MSGANFSRLKNWITEILTNIDLNNEIDNILNNLDPTGVGDYSDTAVMMRLTTNPGTTGNESLASSLAGELERLRYVIKRIVGPQITNWYDAPNTSLTDLLATIGTQNYGNRIISGRTTGNSSQICALIPAGNAAAVILSASVTPFVYAIANQNYTISTNLTISGLSLGPSSNNTCALNALDSNVAVAGQSWTRVWGQFGTAIPIDAANSNFAAELNTLCGFKTANEYFLAYINSTTQLTNAWRGCSFDSSANAVKPAGLFDNDSITIMKTAWIFANVSAALAVTYTNPIISGTQPTSPNTGDYWYDLATTAWKTYNSTTWVNANATLIGFSLQNATACMAARTFDSYAAYNSLNTLEISPRVNDTVVRAKESFSEVQVFGTKLNFGITRPTWDSALHMDNGFAFSPSTVYYLYMKENGNPLISDDPPQYRRDLQGLYYPSETWRAVASVQTTVSTQFVTPVKNFIGVSEREFKQLMIGDNANIYGTASYTPVGNSNQQADMFSNDLVRSSVLAPVNITVSNTFQDFLSFELRPGIWELSASGQLAVSGGTAIGTLWSFGISTASGNAFNDSSPVTNCAEFVLPAATTAYKHTGAIAKYLVRINSPTTYSLKGYAVTVSTAAATLTFQARLTAIRVNQLNGMP